MGWLCPDCTELFQVESTLDGLGCYQQISDGDPSGREWLGFDGDRFLRASFANFALSDQGTATAGEARTIRNRADPVALDVGSFALEVDGKLERGRGRGDPMWGFEPPKDYACGWHREDPRPYGGPWVLETGEILPDGWFRDRCDEPVRLHDQLGRWLVIEVGAMNCGPCQVAAQGEEAFVDQMAADGLDVAVVTLMSPSLSGVLDPAPLSDLREWTDTFDLSMPVLEDRGWGYWLGSAAIGEGFGYPLMVLVEPGGHVVQLQTGFSTWEPVRQTLLEASRG